MYLNTSGNTADRLRQATLHCDLSARRSAQYTFENEAMRSHHIMPVFFSGGFNQVRASAKARRKINAYHAAPQPASLPCCPPRAPCGCCWRPRTSYSTIKKREEEEKKKDRTQREWERRKRYLFLTSKERERKRERKREKGKREGEG